MHVSYTVLIYLSWHFSSIQYLCDDGLMSSAKNFYETVR